MNTQTENQIEFTRVNSDINGNPRFVCHFLNLINANERGYTYAGEEFNQNKPVLDISISEKYAIAVKRANKLGGRKFHNKQYGGGIVFQMYEGEAERMTNLINELKNS